MQYFFQGGKALVQLPSHGNSKHKEQPYYHTQASTLQAIKEKCKTMTASVAYSDVFKAASGIHNSKSVSEEPRNKSRVYNAGKTVKSEVGQDKYKIFDLLSLLKEHQAMEGGGLLSEVQIGSTPCAILASKQQLDNVVTFAVSQLSFQCWELMQRLSWEISK